MTKGTRISWLDEASKAVELAAQVREDASGFRVSSALRAKYFALAEALDEIAVQIRKEMEV